MRKSWLVLLVLGACNGSSSTTTPGAPTTATAKGGATLNGVRVGDKLQTVWDKFSGQLCDEDPIDAKAARVVIFGDCKAKDKPGSFAIYITTGAMPVSEQTILAMGFLGAGSTVETVPPAPIGSSLRAANATLGAPQNSLSLRATIATQFAGDVTLLSEGDTVVGAVYGPMPSDRSAERWRVFDQMQRRYGQHPELVNPLVSAEDCEKVLRHSAELFGDDPANVLNTINANGRYDGEIKECQRAGTPAKIACALAAKTTKELRACE